MKFTIQKCDLMNKLTPCMGTVSNKNTITSIEGILIETMENGEIRLSSYDMNKGVRCTLTPLSIEREGSFILNAQRLYQIIRVLPEDDITLEVNDKLNCTICCGKASFSMFAMRGTDFPNLPDLMTEKGFTISSAVLRRMISKVLHSVAEQDNRPMLCGAYFHIKGNEMEVVSCDSFTLSKCRIVCDISSLGSEGATEFSFIIPGHALNEIMKLLSDKEEDKTDFYLSRKHAILRGESIVFFTRTIDSEYIDYERIIPRDNDIFVTVERERLLSGLERANIIAEEKIQGSGRSYVKVKAEDQYLSLTSSSVNGKVYDEMDCVHEGGDIEIGFNCRYLINSVRAAEGENIRIGMKRPNLAITVEAAEAGEDFSYFYMILPVKMRENESKDV